MQKFRCVNCGVLFYGRKKKIKDCAPCQKERLKAHRSTPQKEIALPGWEKNNSVFPENVDRPNLGIPTSSEICLAKIDFYLRGKKPQKLEEDRAFGLMGASKLEEFFDEFSHLKGLF